MRKGRGGGVGAKDRLWGLWVGGQEFLEERGAEHQKLLSEFEAALGRSQTMWTDQAKGPGNQSLNAALRAARDSRRWLKRPRAVTPALSAPRCRKALSGWNRPWQ